MFFFQFTTPLLSRPGTYGVGGSSFDGSHMYVHVGPFAFVSDMLYIVCMHKIMTSVVLMINAFCDACTAVTFSWVH